MEDPTKPQIDARAQHDISRAIRADQILADEMVQEALKAIKDDIFDKFVATSFAQSDERDELWRKMQQAQKFEQYLLNIMTDGSITQENLRQDNEIQQEGTPAMDPLDTSKQAVDFLKSKRAETSEEAPEAIEDTTDELETEEPEQVEEVEQVEESEENLQSEIEDEEPGVYLIDDEEVTLADIKEWKRGNLRESDYSQKTMALAEDRKGFEAKVSALDAKEKALDQKIDQLESLIGDSGEAIDWDELRDNDPSEYLKQKEKVELKQKALKEAKAEKAKTNQSQSDEYQRQNGAHLAKAFPEWWDDKGSTTQTMTDDLNKIGPYLKGVGFSADDANRLLYADMFTLDPRLFSIFKDAAAFKSTKGVKVLNRLKNAPKVIKPTKARSKPRASVDEEVNTRFKRTGSDDDAVAYLKSRRK